MKKHLIKVGKSEIEYLKEHSASLEYVRTMMQDSKRHNYYIAETRNALAVLNEYWNDRITEHYEK